MIKEKRFLFYVSFFLFIIPEIIFSPITSFFANLFGIINFPFIYSFFINPQFFVDNIFYLFLFLIMESIGIIGLLIWNIKYNKSKFKILGTIVYSIILILLVFIYYVGYGLAHMSLL